LLGRMFLWDIGERGHFGLTLSKLTRRYSRNSTVGFLENFKACCFLEGDILGRIFNFFENNRIVLPLANDNLEGLPCIFIFALQCIAFLL